MERETQKEREREREREREKERERERERDKSKMETESFFSCYMFCGRFCILNTSKVDLDLDNKQNDVM